MLSMNLVWGMEWCITSVTQKKKKKITKWLALDRAVDRQSPAYQEMPHFALVVLLQIDDPQLVLFSHVAMICMLGS